MPSPFAVPGGGHRATPKSKSKGKASAAAAAAAVAQCSVSKKVAET